MFRFPPAALAGGASLLLAVAASAQPADSLHHTPRTDHHPHAGHTMPSPSASGSGHAGVVGHDMHGLVSATAPGAPMSRDGSGTAWLPDRSPMEMTATAAAGWSLGLHGAVFPRYVAGDAFGSGTRGTAGLGAPNWAMGMAQRSLAGTQLTLRLMASADVVTEGGDGYPLLLQSGETFQGERLVDRQHPHDVVSEASVTVARPLAEGVGAFAYLAYPGEPALGPPAFMHRPSARFLADAPLSHHWQDATHIAWGVATAGVVAGPAKLDASAFTGREPDEARLEPDAPRLDSYSARLSLNPSRQWALQVSGAFLREPEALEPGVDQRRVTASALWSAPVGRADATAAVVWGANTALESHDETGGDTGDDGHHGTTHSFLAEGALRLGPNAVFGRGEIVQKAGGELALAGALGEATHTVGTLTLGLGRQVAQVGGVALMLGGQATAYAVPDALRSVYGDAPVSLGAFLRFAPRQMGR